MVDSAFDSTRRCVGCVQAGRKGGGGRSNGGGTAAQGLQSRASGDGGLHRECWLVVADYSMTSAGLGQTCKVSNQDRRFPHFFLHPTVSFGHSAGQMDRL